MDTTVQAQPVARRYDRLPLLADAQMAYAAEAEAQWPPSARTVETDPVEAPCEAPSNPVASRAARSRQSRATPMRFMRRRWLLRRAISDPLSRHTGAAIAAAIPTGTFLVGSGGVGNAGKSTLMYLLAWRLSQYRARQCVGVMSCDHSANGLAVRTGMEASAALRSYLDAAIRLDRLPAVPSSHFRAMLSYQGALGVMLTDHQAIAPSVLEVAVRAWQQHGDMLLLDLGSAVNTPVNRYCAKISSMTVVVTLPEIGRLREAAKLVAGLGDQPVLLIVNMVRPRHFDGGNRLMSGHPELAPLVAGNVVTVWMPYARDMTSDSGRNDMVDVTRLTRRTIRRLDLAVAHIIAMLADIEPIDTTTMAAPHTFGLEE